MALPPIDQLQIEIKAQSKSAATEIDALSDSLAKLRQATRGGVGLSTISKQFNTFSQAVQGMAAPAGKIAALVSALKPLETIGKSNLGSTLNQLKKIPEITNGLDNAKLADFAAKMQQVTVAVRPLATEMEKVSQGFSKLPSNVQKAINANARLTRSNKATAFGFNMMVAKIGIYLAALSRVARTIAGWIKESNDYVENLNLFTASLGEYAGEAQRYAEQVGDILGIDPSAWMRSQGVFNTLIAGFGVAGDKAAYMSKNLVQLGYDLSSFYNISVADAMQKLQSGIAGELEPLRRLGYDLSQAKLQAIALSHGIDKAFTAMTQAEKSQLRYYAVMTQVTVAQGDLARTLEAPANQLRILKAQATQASRALGNIFIPALNAVLPYAIAFLKVIRSVATEIANLFGFTLPEIDYSGIQRVAGDANDLADQMDDANSAAQALRKTIFGFDQLNLMAAPTSGNSLASDVLGGGLDINLPGYDFLGGLVETKTAQIFEAWKKSAEPTMKFIKDNFEEIKDIAIAIGVILLGWKIGTGVAGIVSGLSKIPLLSGGAGLAIGGGAGLAMSIQNVITEGLNGINFGSMLGGAGAFTGGAAMIGKAFGSALIGGAGGAIIGGVALFITGVYDAIVNGINWLSAALIPVGSAAAGAGIGAIIGMLGGPMVAGIGALIGLAVGLVTDLVILIVQNWETIKDGFNQLTTWIDTNVISPVLGFFSGLFSDIKDVFSPAIDWFRTLFEGVWLIIRAVFVVASGWINVNVIQPIVGHFQELKEKIGGAVSAAVALVKRVWEPIGAYFEENVLKPLREVFNTAWSSIRSGFETAFRGIANFARGIFNGVIGYIETLINNAIRALNQVVSAFNGVAQWAAGVLGVSYSGLKPINTVTIRRMSTGGFAVPGELFIAREAGPEMVGSIGGRTAVMNNDQIVESVSQGVAAAVSGVMGGGSNPINIYFDNVLAYTISAAERQNARAGRTVVQLGGK